MADLDLTPYEDIYSEIKKTLLLSRDQAYSAVNFAMVQAYWQIGRTTAFCCRWKMSGFLQAESRHL